MTTTTLAPPTAGTRPATSAAPGPAPVRLGPAPDLDLDLTDPIWTVRHVAAALHLSLDAACAVVARPDFPPARDGFAADLWLREHVLGWFAELPPRGLGAEAAPAARPQAAVRAGHRSQRNSYRRRTR